MAGKLELRLSHGLQVRDAKADVKDSIGTLAGHAAVFNSWSLDLGYFRELILPGAFGESLKRGDDIRAMAHHDARQIIGRRSAGTLSIGEDSTGLAVEISVPDTSAGRDTLASVKRKDLTGMSFQFDVVDDEWSRETVGGETVLKRQLKRVDLYEVSVVGFPAYTATSVEGRGGGTGLRGFSDLDLKVLADVAKAGRERASRGKDAPSASPPAPHARRDMLVNRHRILSAHWTHR